MKFNIVAEDNGFGNHSRDLGITIGKSRRLRLYPCKIFDNFLDDFSSVLVDT